MLPLRKTSKSRRGLAWADVNGDGKLDIDEGAFPDDPGKTIQLIKDGVVVSTKTTVNGVVGWEGLAPGTYTVTLTVTDTNVPAKTATKTATIAVNQDNRAPVAVIDSPTDTDFMQDTAIHFSAASSYDADNEVLTFSWKEGGVKRGAGWMRFKSSSTWARALGLRSVTSASSTCVTWAAVWSEPRTCFAVARTSDSGMTTPTQKRRPGARSKARYPIHHGSSRTSTDCVSITPSPPASSPTYCSPSRPEVRMDAVVSAGSQAVSEGLCA